MAWTSVGELVTSAKMNTLLPAGSALWQNWSPSYANLTIGNGAAVSRYQHAAGIVVARFRFTLGSTSSVGTAPTVSTPVTASSNAYSNSVPIGNIYMKEDGANTYPGTCHLDSTTTIGMFAGVASGTHLTGTVPTSSVPFTWGTSDVLSFTVVYEAA